MKIVDLRRAYVLALLIFKHWSFGHFCTVQGANLKRSPVVLCGSCKLDRADGYLCLPCCETLAETNTEKVEADACRLTDLPNHQ
jgi:hypothetical protein